MPNNQSRKRDHQKEEASKTQCQDDSNITEVKKTRYEQDKEIVKRSPKSIKTSKKFADFVILFSEAGFTIKIDDEKEHTDLPRFFCLLDKDKEIVCCAKFIHRHNKDVENDSIINAVLSKRRLLFKNVKKNKIKNLGQPDQEGSLYQKIRTFINDEIFFKEGITSLKNKDEFYYFAKKHQAEIENWKEQFNVNITIDDKEQKRKEEKKKREEKHRAKEKEIVKHSPKSIKEAAKYMDLVFNIDKEGYLKLEIHDAHNNAQNDSSRISCLLNEKRELICAFLFIDRSYATVINDDHNSALTKRLILSTNSCAKISDPNDLDQEIFKSIKTELSSFIQENNGSQNNLNQDALNALLKENQFFYIAEKYKEEIKECSNKSNNSTKSATSPINTVACKEGDIVDTQTNNESEYDLSSLLEQCEEFDVSEMFTHPYKEIIDEFMQEGDANNGFPNTYLQNIEKPQRVDFETLVYIG